MALERQVALPQLLVFDVLHQDVLEGQLGAVGIHMGAVAAAGQMLGAVVEAVLLVEFKIASGQGIAARHVDVGCVLGFRIVLGQGVGVQLAGEPEVVGIGQVPVRKRIPLLPDHIGQAGAGGISVVGGRTVRGAEECPGIGIQIAVDVLGVLLGYQVVDEVRAAEVHDKGVPLEGPEGVIGAEAPDIADFLQVLPALVDGHHPGHPALHIGLINHGGFGQIVVWDGIGLVGNHHGYGTGIRHAGIHPLVGEAAAHHALPWGK